MQNPESPAGGNFEGLLAAMPRIAEAVNAFKSEENQRVAMNVLVRAMGLEDGPPASAKPAPEPNLSIVPPTAAGQAEDSDLGSIPRISEPKPPNARQRRTRKPGAKKSWPCVKDINFRPAGQQSLQEFAEEMTPGNFHEKNLVAVFYLEEVLSFPSIGVGHVLAAYHECGWKPPADPENSLQVTASHKKWLDTADMKAIRVTYPGRNMIQFDMPGGKTKKSA